MREQVWGIVVVGVTLQPLLLLPLAWFRMGTEDDPQHARKHRLHFKQQGLLLSLSRLALMALSQVLDYHHDHPGEGLALLRDLSCVKGLEECLEYWALLAISKSLRPLAVRKDAAVAELVKGAHWLRLVENLGVMNVGNGLWLGSAWHGWWVYLHVTGVAIAVPGLVLSVRELRSFARQSECFDV